jgi:small redox-active disulfide protein 2
MKIQALGGCCARSTQNYQNAVEAAEKLALGITVEHVKDANQIMKMGVMSTPGLAIDGKVVAMGRLLSTQQIVGLIKQAQKGLAQSPKTETCCDETCGCHGKKS